MVALASLVPRGTKDHRVTLDQSASLAPEESRETLENGELKETRGKRVRLDWRDRKETWV